MSQPRDGNADDVIASESLLASLKKNESASAAVVRWESEPPVQNGIASRAKGLFARVAERIAPRNRTETLLAGMSMGGALTVFAQWYLGHTIKQGLPALGAYLTPCLVFYGMARLLANKYKKHLASTNPESADELKAAVERTLGELVEHEQKIKADFGPKIQLFVKLAKEYLEKPHPDEFDSRDHAFQTGASQIATTIQKELLDLCDQGKTLARQTSRSADLWAHGASGTEALLRFKELLTLARKIRTSAERAQARYDAEIRDFQKKEAANGPQR